MVAMERSNGGRVGEAFDLLATGLSPFVDRQMRAALGDSWMQSFHRPGHSEAREHSLRDPAFLLRVMDEAWDTAFRSRLTRTDRSVVIELRETRNRWAHNEPFDDGGAYRALDSIQLLLAAVGATEEAAVVERSKI